MNRAGLDSMIATELRIRIEQLFGTAPSIVALLADATIESIAEDILAATQHVADDVDHLPATDGDDDDAGTDIVAEALLELMADLDDAEIASLLRRAEDGSDV